VALNIMIGVTGTYSADATTVYPVMLDDDGFVQSGEITPQFHKFNWQPTNTCSSTMTIHPSHSPPSKPSFTKWRSFSRSRKYPSRTTCTVFEFGMQSCSGKSRIPLSFVAVILHLAFDIVEWLAHPYMLVDCQPVTCSSMLLGISEQHHAMEIAMLVLMPFGHIGSVILQPPILGTGPFYSSLREERRSIICNSLHSRRRDARNRTANVAIFFFVLPHQNVLFSPQTECQRSCLSNANDIRDPLKTSCNPVAHHIRN